MDRLVVGAFVGLAVDGLDVVASVRLALPGFYVVSVAGVAVGALSSVSSPRQYRYV